MSAFNHINQSIVAKTAWLILGLSMTGQFAWASDTAAKACLQGLNSEQAKIERVSDGDTVVLTDQRRVRLIGINTAELNAPNPQLRQAAEAAKQELAALLPFGEAVVLYVGEESHDRHGRVLAHVVRASGQLAVAPLLLEQGLAVQSAVAPNTRCADHFAQLETVAAERGIGQWDKLALFTSQAKTLNGDERGFRIVTGKLGKIIHQKRYSEVFLDDTFRLLLRPELASTMKLKRFQGKTIEVRGWLNRRKKQVFLWLQHSSNLRIVED